MGQLSDDHLAGDLIMSSQMGIDQPAEVVRRDNGCTNILACKGQQDQDHTSCHIQGKYLTVHRHTIVNKTITLVVGGKKDQATAPVIGSKKNQAARGKKHQTVMTGEKDQAITRGEKHQATTRLIRKGTWAIIPVMR